MITGDFYDLSGVKEGFRERVEAYFEKFFEDFFPDIKTMVELVIIPEIDFIEYVNSYMEERGRGIYIPTEHGNVEAKVLHSENGEIVVFNKNFFQICFIDDTLKDHIVQGGQIREKEVTELLRTQLSTVFHEFTHVKNKPAIKEVVAKLTKDEMLDDVLVDISSDFVDEYFVSYNASNQYYDTMGIGNIDAIHDICDDTYIRYSGK